MNMLIEIISALLMLFGALFAFVASLGVIRLPDVFMRMHATTKAGTLGAGMILLSVAFAFGTVPVIARSIAIIIFIILTAPVAAHMIGRAAYIARVPMWNRTFIDELRGKYDHHVVESTTPSAEGQAGHKPPPST